MKNRAWPILLVVCIAITACVVLQIVFGLKPKPIKKTDNMIFPCVKTVLAFSAIAEKPDAAKVLLLGNFAGGYHELFKRAGLECFTTPGVEVDMVFAAGERPLKQEKAARSSLSKNGVWAECIDARDMTRAEFRKKLLSVPGSCVHLWMPGEMDWLVVGRAKESAPRLEDMMDVFSREDSFADLVPAKCDSLPILFASYVGEKEDVLPAFAGQNMQAKVRPEYFVQREIPKLDWMALDDVDADIRDNALREMRSMQVVRRMLLVGVIKAENGEEDAAVETWAKVALRSPCDTMLVERLDRLSVNAQVFLKLGKTAMAAKCYDTMAHITPNDPMPVYNYGLCMRQMGEREIAELAFKRADELSRALAPEEASDAE